MDPLLIAPLELVDPETYMLMRAERQQQVNTISLIASENQTSCAVLQALSCALHNRYSEGYPGARYYGGQEVIDKIERLCQLRALELFGLDPQKWGVNVQPLSGSIANLAVYTALVGPHGRIMGLDLPDGGHLTHGYMTGKKKVSASSIYFESLPYKVDPQTGLIDFDLLRKMAVLFRPKIVIAGASCYPQQIDYSRFADICSESNSILMADISHISGLVAARLHPSPFEHCDVVTTSTNKTLRGPRGAMIFYRRGVKQADENGKDAILYDFEKRINDAVFPGLQTGPHNNTLAALLVALKQAKTKQFEAYQWQVISNCKALVRGLQNRGYTISTGGTETHLCLLDLRPTGMDGAKVERALEDAMIICNKNTCPGDKSALRPSGIRLGSPTMTTRGLKEEDFDAIAEFIHRGIQLASTVDHAAVAGRRSSTSKKCKLMSKEQYQMEIEQLRSDVVTFASRYPIAGLPDR